MTLFKRLIELLTIPTGVLLILTAALLWPRAAQAQCGASASSCKNCHEVNAQYPVNTSGDWHISHAFGDFCAFCHAGNVQAKEQSPAHEGMIYPLSDPQGSCQSCHPADYLDLAQVYATALGVDLGGSAPGAISSGGSGAASELAALASEPISPPGERYASGALIDYNRRYAIEVLGHLDDSTVGNTILAVIGVALLIVGFIVVWRLEKLGDVWRSARATPADDWRRLAHSGAYEVMGPVIARAPSAVPAPRSSPALQSAPAVPPAGLETLDPGVQAAVAQLLADPVQGGAILRALARLDPALIHRLQNLDKKDRDLLLAVVEQLGESKL